MGNVVRIQIKNPDALQKIADAIPHKASVKVGIIDNPEIATYAAYNEFGWVQRTTPKQRHFLAKEFDVHLKEGTVLLNPPRPFLRATASANSDDWGKTFAEALKNLGIKNFQQAAKLMARQAQADIQETIRNNGTKNEQFPDRSGMTAKIYEVKDARTAKGRKRKRERDSGSASEKALVKTGALLSAIGYEIEE